MLDTMRSAAKSWAMKAFLGILLASFLLWGIPEAFRYQRTGNSLFSSGDSSVTASDYLFEQQNTLARFAATTRRFLNPAEIRAFGVPQQVMMQLQRRVLLDEEARRMKIGSSDAAVLRLLQQDRLFYDETTGSFDPNRFIGFTQQMQIPQEAIFNQLEQQARRDQILHSITDGLTAPDVFYQATLLYERETRSIDYIKLDADDPATIAEPEEEKLTTWFETQTQNFRAPEYRTITTMHMTRDKMVRPQEVQEETLQAYYEQNRAALMAPERRVIEQLRFKTRQEADEAAAQLQAGVAFDTLVENHGQTVEDIRLPPQSREDLPSLMAPEVFALGQGEVSGVINDLAGPVLVRLVSIEAPEPLAFEDVSDSLRLDIAAREAVSRMRTIRDDIENARFNGATLAELAAEHDLELMRATVDLSGTTAEGEQIGNLPEREILLPAVFQSTVGVDSDPLFNENGYLWYHVESSTSARDKTLDEVRVEAVRAWKEAEAQNLLDERAKNLLLQIQEADNLMQFAEANQLQINSVGGLQRGSVNAILGREANRAIFSTLEGGFGMVQGPTGGERLLFKVTSSADPTSTSRDALSQQDQAVIQAQMSRDLEGQFILFSQDSHPVTQNLPLLETLLNQ